MGLIIKGPPWIYPINTVPRLPRTDQTAWFSTILRLFHLLLLMRILCLPVWNVRSKPKETVKMAGSSRNGNSNLIYYYILISSGIARKSYNFIRIMYKINQNDWPKWSKYTDIPNHYSKIPKESGVVFAICFKGYCTVPPKPSFKESKMTWSLATCHAWYSSMEPGRSNLGSTCRNWPQHAQLAVAYWKKLGNTQLRRFFFREIPWQFQCSQNLTLAYLFWSSDGDVKFGADFFQRFAQCLNHRAWCIFCVDGFAPFFQKTQIRVFAETKMHFIRGRTLCKSFFLQDW